MKKFIDDLKQELSKRGMSEAEMNEIIADHEDMISAAIQEGLSEEELVSKFGDPKHLADELAGETPKVRQDMDDEFSLWQEFTPTDGKQTVEVKLVSEDVEYYLTEKNQIEVYANRTKRLTSYQLSYDNGALQLKRNKEVGIISFIPFRFGEVSFKIGFPITMTIADFSHTSVNSDVEIVGIHVERFKLVTTNGDVQIDSAKLGDASWNTVNGDIQVQSSQFNSIASTQVSGDFELRDSSISETLKIHTVSGDAKIENCDCDLLDLESVSGDVVGKNLYPQKASLKSVSGDILICNQEQKPIQVIRSHSVSGEIQIQ